MTGTHFSIQIVLFVVQAVCDAAGSLRTASEVLRIAARLDMIQGPDEIAHTTVRNLILRIGLHELTRPKEQAEDWIWIVDHSISAGTTKCLIVAGIRQSAWRKLARRLEHRDLALLALLPVETSNGAVVCEQFLQLAQVTGVPRAILSDQGSDLKRGVELLQGHHDQVIGLSDIVHRVCRMIAANLDRQSAWGEYRQACCRCGNHIRQSRLAHLKPPKPKVKARELNYDREVQWGARALACLDQARSASPRADADPSETNAVLEKYLGWLDSYRDHLVLWESLILMGQSACSVVRQYGYGEALCRQLEARLPPGDSPEASELREQIQEFCRQQSELAAPQGSLPGSTEVLESLIGKGKRLAGFHSTNSFTGQVLSIAASVVDLSEEVVRAALANCRIKHVAQWCRDNLPESLQSRRKRELAPTKAEQNMRKQMAAATPNF
jgi:hypothetical protein